MDLQLNEEQGAPRAAEPKGLYKLVISWGLAKDEKGARTVLTIVAIAALILAILYPFLFS